MQDSPEYQRLPVSHRIGVVLQPTASQLRERADSLAAEVDSLRAALAKATGEGNLVRSELGAALAELQLSKATLAARDEEIEALRSRLSGAGQAPPEQQNGPAGAAATNAPPSAVHPPVGPPIRCILM